MTQFIQYFYPVSLPYHGGRTTKHFQYRTKVDELSDVSSDAVLEQAKQLGSFGFRYVTKDGNNFVPTSGITYFGKALSRKEIQEKFSAWVCTKHVIVASGGKAVGIVETAQGTFRPLLLEDKVLSQ